MPFETWLAFVVACSVVLAIPGPTVLLVVSYALGQGRRTGWRTVPGVALGDLTAMTASLAGAGAILAASATAFTVLKIAGAIYLVWLGWRMWRAGGPAMADSDLAPEATRKRQRRMFWHAYAVTALNPKSIIFFIAFVPQFVTPHEPVLLQFAILEATFVGMAAAVVLLWVLLVDRLRTLVRSSRAWAWLNRGSGSLLIGAGIYTAAMQRA